MEEDTRDPNRVSYITPVCTVPVEVRSKRNNLKRKIIDLSSFLTADGRYDCNSLVNPSSCATSSTVSAALQSFGGLQTSHPYQYSHPIQAVNPSISNGHSPATSSLVKKEALPSALTESSKSIDANSNPQPFNVVTTTATAHSNNTVAADTASNGYIGLDIAVDNVVRWAGKAISRVYGVLL